MFRRGADRQFLDEQRFRFLRAGDDELFVTAADMDEVGMALTDGSTGELLLVVLFPDE